MRVATNDANFDKPFITRRLIHFVGNSMRHYKNIEDYHAAMVKRLHEKNMYYPVDYDLKNMTLHLGDQDD